MIEFNFDLNGYKLTTEIHKEGPDFLQATGLSQFNHYIWLPQIAGGRRQVSNTGTRGFAVEILKAGWNIGYPTTLQFLSNAQSESWLVAVDCHMKNPFRAF